MKKQSDQKTLILFVGLILFTCAVHGNFTDEVTQGAIQVFENTSGEPQILELPLKHTDVKIEISGFVARAFVTQTFTNPLDHAIEAQYVFPLPDDAAVDQMEMKIGDRVITGVIKQRDEAEKIYHEARQNGQTASLLTQERPNIFTQSIANILPDDEIEVRISYVHHLEYDDGRYEVNFPMVVGPRFIPGQPTGKSGGGWAPDTDIVSDASKITPPVLKPGTRSGHDIAVTVHLHSGLPFKKLWSPSHHITETSRSECESIIKLNAEDTIPNKDFILRYRLDGEQPETALLTHSDEQGGFFSLMIQPQAEFDASEVVSKEMIFVVDCSGSMSGAPIRQAKATMKKFIAGMNPNDSFQIIRFSSNASQFSSYPLPNRPSNVQRGLQYVNQLSGSGGTMMIEGIKASLDYPHDPNRLRMVVFMTDGYIGNETQILGAIEKKIGQARLFSFGVGSSVNHYLLDRMAEVGRGFTQYVRPDEDTNDAVNLFYKRINNPLLTDIQVDWNGLDVHDVYPGLIPDLFSSQPVIIKGRYSYADEGEVIVYGKLAGKHWERRLSVSLPEFEPQHDALASIWARARVKSLMQKLHQGQNANTIKQITDTALEFNLMSQYTAFVAVTDEIRRDENGRIETIQVPVEMPEMVSYEGVFGGSMDRTVRKKAAPSSGFFKTISSKVTGAMSFGRSNERCDVAQPICEEQEITKKPHVVIDTDKAMQYHIRMLSGNIERTLAEGIIERTKGDIEAVMKNAQVTHLIIRLTTDKSGKITSVEVLNSSNSDSKFEKMVEDLFTRSRERFNGGGQITVKYML